MTTSIATDKKIVAKLPGTRQERHTMPRPVDNALSGRVYIGDLTFDDYLKEIRQSYPGLYDLLEPTRIEAGAIDAYIKEMERVSWEFEDKDVGGRGVAYIRAQESFDNRRVGMETLIKCFSASYSDVPGPEFRILDVLGGGGTVARFLSTLEIPTPSIITADLSKLMIGACRAKHLPYIRQSAARSLFRDNVLDGVLIAYGSQLLSLEVRQLAVSEAHRTLKPGHRLVLHAFEVGEHVARFFDEVVHPYSRTGHPHEHFTRPGILDIFTRAGFRDLRLFEISDPFILRGQTPDEARRNAIMHLYRMYDLVKVANAEADIESALGPLITDTLGPISISRDQDNYAARIPRTTLVAVGTKSQ
ncbi:methyltransferase domain-containing protein [uncultured Bradyrhizobium sp.]|uniref:methyltransferase domain-containing protein n=1 Tax=uncultured Bradyrhizobium sp. TaxID=199684 RepID=UPI0035CBAFB2